MAKKQPARRTRRQPGITSITYWRKFATHRIIYLGLAALIGLGIVAYFGTSPFGSSTAARREYLADVVATVNGEPILRGEYERVAERARRTAGTSIAMAAMQEGYLLSGMVDQALLRAEAKRRGIRVSDDDVDRAINEMRTLRQSGRTERLNDEDLLKMTGMETMSDLRESVAKDLLPQRLGEALARTDRLTFDDLARSYDEVRVRHILVAVSGDRAPLGKGLPEAQARRRVEQILDQLHKGADFAKLADQYSDDPSNKVPGKPGKGGDLGWYKRGGGYDKAFEEAAFALKKGEMSGLVRTPFGFHIIKVEDTRRQLPADYEKNKAQLLQTFRSQKASEALRGFLEKERPRAKIVWKDPALEWRYAYARSGLMGGLIMPGRQDQQKAEEDLVRRLRAYVPKHKTDSAAALVLGQMLNRQLMMANLPAALTGGKAPKVDKEKLRAEVIQCYEIALQHAEDQDTRLSLARMYQEAKQPQKALEQYRMMHRLLAWDNSVETRFIREQVERGLRELGDKKMADEEAKKIAEIKAKEEQERKEAAERAKAEQARRAAAANKAGHGTASSGAKDGKTPSTASAPARTNAKPAEAASKTGSDTSPAAGRKTTGSSGTFTVPVPQNKPGAGGR